MKTKTPQHKNRLFFIPAILIAVIITGFFSLQFISHVRQAGIGDSGLSSEANPATRGQAIVFSPPKVSAAYNRRVLFENSASSAKSADRRKLNSDPEGSGPKNLRSAVFCGPQDDLAGYPARTPLVETPARKGSTKG